MSKKIKLHLSKDPKLKTLVEQIKPFPKIEVKEDVYFNLVRSIVGQQLSTKAAATIFGRFQKLFKDEYPHPKQLVKCSTEHLRTAGISRQKSQYVKNVAQHFIDHKLFKTDWSKYSDEEILDSLTQIKGVGTWTTQMILMFTLARPDIFPTLDVGIQNAMKRLYGLEETGKALKQKMTELAEAWSPYRTYACYFLWRYLDDKT